MIHNFNQVCYSCNNSFVIIHDNDINERRRIKKGLRINTGVLLILI